MNLRSSALCVASLFCLLAPAALAEEPWEAATIAAIRAMNQGDGATYVTLTHTETKHLMRRLMLDSIAAAPAGQSGAMLKDFGVSSVAECEALGLDVFIEKMIRAMHFGSPPAYRSALSQARFTAIESKLVGDIQHVTVQIEVSVNGQQRSSTVILFAKREGEVWKYNGDDKSARGPVKTL